MPVVASGVPSARWPSRVVRKAWSRLRREFLKAGRVQVKEKQGYMFWGPIVAAISVIEVLGAVSKWLEDKIPWPTISTTIGHLEDRWPPVGLIVVGVIAATTFQALAPKKRSARGRTVRTAAPRVQPVSSVYDWPLVYLVVLVAGAVAVATPMSKLQRGYIIYGALALLGIVVPSFLAYWVAYSVRFPTLFQTVRYLRRRLHWLAVALIVGLSILVVHLALHPWPDLARESAKYAGLNAGQARKKAVNEVERLHPGTSLTYRSAARGSFENRDAWLVYFETSRGFGSGCIVIVTSKAATPTAECSR